MSDGGECRPAAREGEDWGFSDGCEAAFEVDNWPSVESEALCVSGDGKCVGWAKRGFFCESFSISSVDACGWMSVREVNRYGGPTHPRSL